MSKPGTGLHKPVRSKATVRKGDARLYEPPVYCAAEGCNERLTIAAVHGGSPYHSRVCAGYAVASEAMGKALGHPRSEKSRGAWSADGGRTFQTIRASSSSP